jgi:hypothetical protein
LATNDRTYNCWHQSFDTQKEVDEALRFTLSQRVTTTTSSSDIRIANMTDAAKRYTSMEEREQQELLLKAFRK